MGRLIFYLIVSLICVYWGVIGEWALVTNDTSVTSGGQSVHTSSGVADVQTLRPHGMSDRPWPVLTCLTHRTLTSGQIVSGNNLTRVVIRKECNRKFSEI